MKALTKTLLNKLDNYMNTETRPLEKSIFNYYFNGSSSDPILDSLEESSRQII